MLFAGCRGYARIRPGPGNYVYHTVSSWLRGIIKNRQVREDRKTEAHKVMEQGALFAISPNGTSK